MKSSEWSKCSHVTKSLDSIGHKNAAATAAAAASSHIFSLQFFPRSLRFNLPISDYPVCSTLLQFLFLSNQIRMHAFLSIYSPFSFWYYYFFHFGWCVCSVFGAQLRQIKNHKFVLNSQSAALSSSRIQIYAFLSSIPPTTMLWIPLARWMAEKGYHENWEDFRVCIPNVIIMIIAAEPVQYYRNICILLDHSCPAPVHHTNHCSIRPKISLIDNCILSMIIIIFRFEECARATQHTIDVPLHSGWSGLRSI